MCEGQAQRTLSSHFLIVLLSFVLFCGFQTRSLIQDLWFVGQFFFFAPVLTC